MKFQSLKFLWYRWRISSQARANAYHYLTGRGEQAVVALLGPPPLGQIRHAANHAQRPAGGITDHVHAVQDIGVQTDDEVVRGPVGGAVFRRRDDVDLHGVFASAAIEDGDPV